MILQALKKYYERKAADAESGIAPEGWEWKEISFLIVLNADGDFVCFEDVRDGEGKKKRGKKFLVPQGVKKASGVAANLLWDTSNYVLGVGDKRGTDLNAAFKKRITEEVPDSKKKNALVSFFENSSTEKWERDECWEEILTTKPNMTFRFDGELSLYCQSDDIKEAVNQKKAGAVADGLCLVSGENDTISVLHTAIKGIAGAQSTGANIVSFNLPPFCSYGRSQGMNAPVGTRAMFAYTTALNTLLSSKQKMRVGDASTVFWSARATRLEDDFLPMLSESSKDDPDANTNAVETLFKTPQTGAYYENEDNIRFYVLGLSPNAARLSIRFWKTGRVKDFAENIRQHFIDLEMVKPASINEPKYYSIWRLLVNAASQDKSENIPPNIAGDFMRSILDGTPYPATLLLLVLLRIKSDVKYRVKPVRAALIKAYLNRYDRSQNKTEKELVSMSLNKESESAPYHLGRLFAVLEKIQEEANPGINATIRERYYGSACCTPVAVFPTLLRLKNHHIAKLESKGRGVNLEKLIGEIAGHFEDFPKHLNLHDQGRFAVGYYHQRQDLFTPHKDNETA